MSDIQPRVVCGHCWCPTGVCIGLEVSVRWFSSTHPLLAHCHSSCHSPTHHLQRGLPYTTSSQVQWPRMPIGSKSSFHPSFLWGANPRKQFPYPPLSRIGQMGRQEAGWQRSSLPSNKNPPPTIFMCIKELSILTKPEYQKHIVRVYWNLFTLTPSLWKKWCSS